MHTHDHTTAIIGTTIAATTHHRVTVPTITAAAVIDTQTETETEIEIATAEKRNLESEPAPVAAVAVTAKDGIVAAVISLRLRDADRSSKARPTPQGRLDTTALAGDHSAPLC